MSQWKKWGANVKKDDDCSSRLLRSGLDYCYRRPPLIDSDVSLCIREEKRKTHLDENIYSNSRLYKSERSAIFLSPGLFAIVPKIKFELNAILLSDAFDSSLLSSQTCIGRHGSEQRDTYVFLNEIGMILFDTIVQYRHNDILSSKAEAPSTRDVHHTTMFTVIMLEENESNRIESMERREALTMYHCLSQSGSLNVAETEDFIGG